jgi:hypothetical protein
MKVLQVLWEHFAGLILLAIAGLALFLGLINIGMFLSLSIMLNIWNIWRRN